MLYIVNVTAFLGVWFSCLFRDSHITILTTCHQL